MPDERSDDDYGEMYGERQGERYGDSAVDAIEARKTWLLAAAADAVADGQAGVDDRATYLSRYYRHVAADDIATWSPAEVMAVANDHLAFAQERPIGSPKARVFARADGPGRIGRYVVEVVTDDVPFLVDSVTQELSRQSIAIDLVIHPQFVVRRDLDGRLLEVLGTLDAHEAPSGALTESWMHLEVTSRSGSTAFDVLQRDVLRVLGDVRDAVEDWPRMRGLASQTAGAMDADVPPSSSAVEVAEAAEVAEVAEFLRWLAAGHFTFLGMREYRLVDDDGAEALAAVPGTGLGVLRSDELAPRPLLAMPAELRSRVRDRQPLLITKTNTRATVHRAVHADDIGVKMFDSLGAVIGERRFIGLFTSAAYHQPLSQIPLLRRKAHAVLEQSGFAPASHSGKDLAEILEELPRDELFQISVPDLYETAMGVLHLQERRRLRLFLRRDSYARFVSCLVYLPRDHYDTQARLKMRAILLESLGGVEIEDALRVDNSVLARVHFTVQIAAGASVLVDRVALEARLAAATQPWEDDFADAVSALDVHETATAAAFPAAYKEDFSAETGLRDLRKLEALVGHDELEPALYEPIDKEACDLALKLYRAGGPVSLSVILPILQAMGVQVTDERPYEVHLAQGRVGWIYDFGLRHPAIDVDASPATLHDRFHDGLVAAWRGFAEVDGFQALILEAGLTWRQVVVLRAYAKYLRQAGTRFSQEYLETTLRANARIVRLLVSLFESELDPEFVGDRETTSQSIADDVGSALDAVASLDQDRILRSFLALVRATLRTNYWQRDAEGAPRQYLSLKLDSRAIPDLPQPRPMVEVFVYSARVEGIHLRFGPVARGGIRYSDRREDFRTEILGLAKTQTVKNAVIVPVGSKGGFVVKRPPVDSTDREALQAEVIDCYRTLIHGLLDVTDNLAGDTVVVPPVRVVRRDGDDSYLVVAADKGTATFSDLANAISADYGFWLGDAFASGGSAGYDHKAMGITARGAWESVVRHFIELGINCQTTDFTCVGIGDMSGDVFGNGMLLSPHIRLVAAFDHRHIFVDPEPDAATSLAERRRLFALPGSSWAEYGIGSISPGGGVWSRAAKSIPVSAEMGKALGIEQADGLPTAMAPNDLMRAILRAPADLLWNGGIGTYVKARDESHADAGDRANDAIRVDGSELRCRVVGEGGNLGFTQLGRVEFALRGGRINTDAIDNSAGVDTSDHEVNIKILLAAAARSGSVPTADRGALLVSMTDEVGALVLRDNYAQNLALTCSQAQAPAMLRVHADYLNWLESNGHLVRALEGLPNADTIEERRSARIGLTRPELAVLLAYAKITTTQAILASQLPEDAFAQQLLTDYFPTVLPGRCGRELAAHPLRREIIATGLANQLVNMSGSTFVFRMSAETSAPIADIVRAHTVARRCFAVDDVWHDIESLDGVVASEVQAALLLGVRQLLDRATRWLVANGRSPLEVNETVARFAPGVAAVLAGLPRWMRDRDAEELTSTVQRYIDAQVPPVTAASVAALTHGLSALAVVDIAVRRAADQDDVASVHFVLGEELGLSELAARIARLPRETRWQTLARAAARDDLEAAHAELTTDVLLSTSGELPAESRLAAWKSTNALAVERAAALIDDIVASADADLAILSVALREVRALARSAASPGG